MPAGVSQDWWSAVQKQIRELEYHVSWQERASLADLEAAYQAFNRANGLRTYFTADGIRVIPQGKDRPAWEWGLKLTSYGQSDNMVPPAAANLATNTNRVECRRGDLTEWYVNDSRGLEPGFTIRQRPAGAADKLRLELAVTGNLRGAINEDGESVDFFTTDGERAINYGQLRVSDARGQDLPARFEVDDDRLAFLVDDSGAVYPVTVDPLATSPSWSQGGVVAYGRFGYSVSSAGDVNGDGYSDVIVGAPYFSFSLDCQGWVFVFLGSAVGLRPEPAWIATGDQEMEFFGVSVATAGDVNGDGYNDVIIGAPDYDNGEGNEGRAYVYHGSATGLQAAPAWIAESNVSNSESGGSVATAGDVNGDGYSDVVVGAWAYTNGEYGEGRAYVYHGSAAGLSTTPAWSIESNKSWARFGRSVSTAGDVNGDGFSDIVIGADEYSNGETLEGATFVYHSSANGSSATPAWITESDRTSAQYGYSVSSAGDVNGGGYSDVIIGAYNLSDALNTQGRVYVYHGSATGLSTSAAWTKESNQEGARFGYSVASAGDVNGDGYSDVIVGAPYMDDGQLGGRASTRAARTRIMPSSGRLHSLAVETGVTRQSGPELWTCAARPSI